MSVDDILNFVEQLALSSGLSIESLSLDQITGILSDAGIDLADFSSDQLEKVFSSLGIDSDALSNGSSTSVDSHQHHDVSFTGAGRCGWCYGTGVVWSGGQNVTCTHCGGSGLGPV